MILWLYSEITYMEMHDSKYIDEVTVSNSEDVEIYNILQRLRRREKKTFNSNFKIQKSKQA